MHARGVGPPPIPVDEFSLPKLVDAITFMLDPKVLCYGFLSHVLNCLQIYQQRFFNHELPYILECNLPKLCSMGLLNLVSCCIILYVTKNLRRIVTCQFKMELFTSCSFLIFKGEIFCK